MKFTKYKIFGTAIFELKIEGVRKPGLICNLQYLSMLFNNFLKLILVFNILNQDTIGLGKEF